MEKEQGEPGKGGETNTAAGAPGDTDPGTETSTGCKSELEDEAEERRQREVGSYVPRRPTPDQVPRALGGRSALAWGRAEPTQIFF